MRYPILVWNKLPANGVAIYPFILLREHRMKTDDILLNHEKIHLRQQLELLIIPFYLLYLLHYIFNIIRLGNHQKAYESIVFEKEAYASDRNLAYLKNRHLFAWINFL